MSIPNVITARKLIEVYFGTKIQTRVYESDVTVGTTVAKLGNYANVRTELIVSNSGNSTVALGFSNNVTATTGIQLAAGGALSFTWFEDNELVMVDVWAISGMSGNEVHVVESGLSGL